ncbi:MAG: TIGR00159 family protein [Chloroflexi bacterium]|nr:TIGR00159 family protein [Chloroflexota bacterium]
MIETLLALFAQFTLRDAIDILLVTAVFYVVLRFFAGTQGVPLLRGFLVVALLGVLAGSVTGLTAFSWLIRTSALALLIAIPVIFQPELRRLLERLGRTGYLFMRPNRTTGASKLIADLVGACTRLARLRFGAIIVLEDQIGLEETVETGVRLQSLVNPDLLVTIFYPGTPLHDGAVVIRDERIEAAACVLPLTQRPLVDTTLGTRHRAGIGITEDTDALAIIISEETGTISAARNGRLARRLDERKLRRILERFYEHRGRLPELEEARDEGETAMATEGGEA